MRNPVDYRPGVGIVLLNAHNQIFIGQRFSGSSEAWQMPQGGIDEGEDPLQAAFRELEEEIGTKNAQLIHAIDAWVYYDIPRDIAQGIWGGRFKGQRQKWFVMRFLGDDREINIQTTHPEFRSWRWSNPAEIPSLAIGFRQESYHSLLNTLRLKGLIA